MMGAKNPSNTLQRILDSLRRLFRRRGKSEPEDPHAYRMAPRRRPPGSRSGAAVAELDEH